MILVQIEVPSLDRQYQFNLDESVRVETIIAEVVEVISQREQCRLTGEVSGLSLCSKEREIILDRGKSLFDQGIKKADTLILL